MKCINQHHLYNKPVNNYITSCQKPQIIINSICDFTDYINKVEAANSYHQYNAGTRKLSIGVFFKIDVSNCITWPSGWVSMINPETIAVSTIKPERIHNNIFILY
jgi:hypothetical protein